MPLVSISDVVDKSFDYVVAGGGTAGLTLAVRLSEDPNVSVLVLEAGGAHVNDPAILRPASYGSHFRQEEYDWDYTTVPQKWAANTEFHVPSGKGLGGSSQINFLVWSRPPAAEIDDFERLGNPGWNWKDYVKYSKKIEKFLVPSPEDVKKGDLRAKGLTDGTSGHITVAFPKTLLDMELPIQETMLRTGFKHANDPIGGDPHGVAFYPQTVNPATLNRSYVTNGYYLPVQDRKNLSVLTGARVNRLVNEKGADGIVTAKSVEFKHDDKTHTVRIGKEVVLSAGAFRSPQILELSGIGLKHILEPLGIKQEIDLPVGENVQDHIYAGISFEVSDDVEDPTLDVFRDPEQLQKHLGLQKEGQGLFSTGLTSFSFCPLQDYSPRGDEIQKAAKERILKNTANYPPGLLEQYQIQLERMEKKAPGLEICIVHGFLSAPNPPEPGKKYFTPLIIMNHNLSRGTLHITSTDPNVNSALDPHYLEQPSDLETLIEGTKYVRRLKDVEPFKKYVVKEVNPGPEVQTDEQIGDWLKKYLSTTYHTGGSAAMLPKEKGGVVDPRLKVYGTSNIRVVDGSIIPLYFSAHPQATVYVIAEKAADLIKEDAKN